jgi:hypothetical protein
MIVRRPNIFSLAPALVLLLALSGCSHEVLNVPARSSMLGSIRVDQRYEMRVKTEMDPLDGTDTQPTIDLWHWNNSLLPAEAFERVPFPIEADGADSVNVFSVALIPGTPISFTRADIYSNCHVYIGRVLAGDAQNVHLLLVVPIGDSKVPSLTELQAEDNAYLAPAGSVTTQAAPTTQ